MIREDRPPPSRGVARYDELVAICRELGVLSPEDPYVTFPGSDVVVAPLFLLYDYSFRDPSLSKDEALAAAAAKGIRGADEVYLHPDPYPTREAWCAARVSATVARLDALGADTRTVLVSHFPLRRDLAVLPRIPSFELWCGTRATEDWHLRYRAVALVSGHLHIPGTQWRDGVRCEEVSFGYPRERRHRPDDAVQLREIL